MTTALHLLNGDYGSMIVPIMTVDTRLEDAGIDSVYLMAITINEIDFESFKVMTERFSKIKAFAIAARFTEDGVARTETVAGWIQSFG